MQYALAARVPLIDYSQSLIDYYSYLLEGSKEAKNEDFPMVSLFFKEVLK